MPHWSGWASSVGSLGKENWWFGVGSGLGKGHFQGGRGKILSAAVHAEILSDFPLPELLCLLRFSPAKEAQSRNLDS